MVNSTGTYGPYQYAEAFIPRTILNALDGNPLTLGSDGGQAGPWLFVRDYCAALRLVLLKGTPGDTYNVGGMRTRSRVEIVDRICELLDELAPRADRMWYRTQKLFVGGSAGDDCCSAIDTSKIRSELGWAPVESFETGIRKTVLWYLEEPPLACRG